MDKAPDSVLLNAFQPMEARFDSGIPFGDLSQIRVFGITGASGGVGKRLAQRLRAAGKVVRAFVRPSSDTEALRLWGVELVFGDIRDLVALARFSSNLDVCFHLAAQVSKAHPDVCREVNVEGTRAVCTALRMHNPTCRLVYCSSIVAKDLSFMRRFTLSAYAKSKCDAESIVRRCLAQGDLQVTIIYPGYVYGPYDRHFLPAVASALRNGMPFVVRGGEQNAPIVYVDDLCDLFCLAATSKIAVGKSYSSLKQNELGIHGFLRLLANHLGYHYPRRRLPRWPLVVVALTLGVVWRLLRNEKEPPLTLRVINFLSSRGREFLDDAKRDLGWDHVVSFEEGITQSSSYWTQLASTTVPTDGQTRSCFRR